MHRRRQDVNLKGLSNTVEVMEVAGTNPFLCNSGLHIGDPRAHWRDIPCTHPPNSRFPVLIRRRGYYTSTRRWQSVQPSRMPKD